MERKNKIFILLSLFALVSTLFNLHFSFSKSYLSTEKVFKKNIEKVVEIKVELNDYTYSYATGSFIGEGEIITNKHVVCNSVTGTIYSRIFVRMATNEEYISASILKVSDKTDLALLHVSYANENFFKVSENFDDGEQIYTIGNPNNFGLSFSVGYISSKSRHIIYDDNTLNIIQLDLSINEGNSGGPVFNSLGLLYGIISFRFKNNFDDPIEGISFAIPSYEISSFLV